MSVIKRYFGSKNVAPAIWNNSSALSQVLNTSKISKIFDFPDYLITKIDPTLKSKFKITKSTTWNQQQLYNNAIKKNKTQLISLDIEPTELTETDIIDKVHHTARSIHCHTTFFQLSKSQSLSPVPKPTVNIFRRVQKYDSIKQIAMNYDCHLWFSNKLNVFGVFGMDYFKKRCCIFETRQYIQKVMDMDMDYIQCDESFKRHYISKHSYNELIKECNIKFDKDSYFIETQNCHLGFIWIWSENKECRKYIKDYIENDLRNFIYKYIKIDQSTADSLFGSNGEFDKLFRSAVNKSNKYCYLFLDTVDGKEHRFMSQTWYNFAFCESSNQYLKSSLLWICLDIRDYSSINEAKEILQIIENMVNSATKDYIKWIFDQRYHHIFNSLYRQQIDKDLKVMSYKNVMLVKSDGCKSSVDQLREMIYDNIIVNTIIVEDFECRQDANIFKRLMVEDLMEYQLKFIESINANGSYSVVIHDEKLKEMECKTKIENIVLTAKSNKMHKIPLQNKYYSHIILGSDGKQLIDILKHCNVNTSMIQVDQHVYIGMDKNDTELSKLFSIINDILNNITEIKLTPRQWIFWRRNEAWNIKLLQKEYKNCCFQLCDLTANTLLVYAPKKLKDVIIDKITYCKL